VATPEVKVRLSAEGVAEVVSAFRKVASEAKTTSKKTTDGFGAMNGAMSTFRSLLPALSVAAVGAGLVRLGRNALSAADELDETAQRLGVTTDFLQEMQFAAVSLGTDTEKLGAAFTFLERKISEAAAKGEPVIRFLDGTAIASKNADGSVRGLEAVFGDIVEIFPRLQEGVSRTGVATELFGSKMGAGFVNMLSAGSDAMERLRAEAKATGQEMSSGDIRALGSINDQLELMRSAAEKAFATGLIRSFGAELENVGATLKDPQMQVGAQALGGLVGSIGAGGLRNYKAVAVGIASIVSALGPLLVLGPGYVAALAAVLGGGSVAYALRDQAQSTAVPGGIHWGTALKPMSAHGGGSILPGLEREDPGAAAAAQKAQAAAAKAEAAAKREAYARQRAAEAVAGFEAKLLELQGDRHAAALADIEAEAAKYRENLDAMKSLSQEEIDTRVAGYKAAATARAEYDDAAIRAAQAEKDLQAEIADVNRKLAAGKIDEADAEREIASIEAARLPNLRSLAADMTTIAAATKDPALIQSAKEFAAAVEDGAVAADQSAKAQRELKADVAQLEETFKDSAEGATSDFFLGLMDGTKSASEAFKDFTASIVSAWMKMIADMAAKKLFAGGLGALFGGAASATGSAFGFAEGGYTGAGDPAQPAGIVHRGEFVVPAPIVAIPGMRDRLENMRRAGPSFVLRRPSLPQYEAGGYVTGPPASRGGRANLIVQVTPDVMGLTLGDWLSRHLASEASKL